MDSRRKVQDNWQIIKNGKIMVMEMQEKELIARKNGKRDGEWITIDNSIDNKN